MPLQAGVRHVFRGIRKRLASFWPAFLLTVGPGVVSIQRPIVTYLEATRSFYTLNLHFIDVDLLTVGCVAKLVVGTQIDAGPLAAGYFATQNGVATGDLVFEA